MKKETRFLVPILLLVAGIVIAGITLLKPNKVESQEYAPLPNPLVSTVISEPLVVAANAGVQPFESAVDGPITLDDLIKQLEELEQINIAMLRQPGWYHTTTKSWTQARESESALELSPGVDISYLNPGPISISDHWSQVLDSQGTLGRGSFDVDTDPEGNEKQVVVSDDQIAGNLTWLENGLQDAFGSKGQEAAAGISPGGGQAVVKSRLTRLISGLKSVAPYLVELTAHTSPDEETLVFHYETKAVTPYDFDNQPEPVIGFFEDYTIRKSDGEVMAYTTGVVLESGLVSTDATTITLVAEMVPAMPPEVQANYEAKLQKLRSLLPAGE